MSDLRPLGSEKLPVDEKLKRIMEIANYGISQKSNITEGNSTKSVQFIKESSNGVYGIVKEKEGYFVKKGLTEGSLDYIGGIFMKNKNKFKSYSEALKRLELISGQESLNEAKKYVLKTKDSEPVADAPVEDVPAEPVADAPVDDAPIDDLPPADSGIEDEIPSDEPAMEPEGEEGEEEGKRSDYMADIQKFSGKLGQALRDVKEKMESDDIKYVINMVLSAVNIDSLDEEDREEIAERFEPKDDFSDEEGMDDIPSEDSDMEGELPSDEELDEIMDKLESFVDAPIEETSDLPEPEEIEEKRIEDIADLSVRHEEVSEMEEDVELDLDELKKEINKNVDDTLSKYFK
jgi:hypothetical protein